MADRRGDGLTTPHSQPAKKLTTKTTDFILDAFLAVVTVALVWGVMQ